METTSTPWRSVFERSRAHQRAKAHTQEWRPKLAPQPPWIPFVGHLPERGSGMLRMLERVHRNLGSVVRFEYPISTAHSFAAPDDIERILISEQRKFTKDTFVYRVLKQFLGNGLLTSDGDFWKRQRRIAAPAFHKKRIDGFAETMRQHSQHTAEKLLTDARDGNAIDVGEYMSELALSIVGTTLLSFDPSHRADEIYDALGAVLRESLERINQPLRPPPKWPTPNNRRYQRAMASLDSIVYAVIEARRSGQRKDDLLQMFLEVKDEETGESMNDIQLRDEVMTMFLAGHETTAATVSWTLGLLHQRPRLLRDVLDEVDSHSEPTTEQLMQCSLLRRVIQESMRLYPPIPNTVRGASEDVELGGYDVPRGSLCFVAPWVVHRSPVLWQNAAVFDPDRFLPERAKLQHKLQYIPFIAGPRMCIGAGFAMMEAQIILATLLRSVRFEPMYELLEPEPLLTMRPQGGLWMKVTARR